MSSTQALTQAILRGQSPLLFSPLGEKGSEIVYVCFQGPTGTLEFEKIDDCDIPLPSPRRKKRKAPPTDLQSGIIQRSSAACEQAAYAIRSAHQHLSAKEALKTIGTIWESLEKTGQLAEARTRFCLPKLPELQLADSPAWLTEQLGVLSQPDDDLAASHPLTIEATERLICACIQSSKTDAKADVQKVPLGNVLVDWNVEPNSLHWEVEAARLPWPGVKVNAMVVDNSGDKPQTHTRIFHTAFEVIEHFNEQLHEFGIQEGLR